MPVDFGALLLRPDALPDANLPLFPGLEPAQWCAGLPDTTEAEEQQSSEINIKVIITVRMMATSN